MKQLIKKIYTNKIFLGFKSLRLKFAVPVIISIALLFLLFGIINYTNHIIIEKRNLKSKANIMFELSSKTMADPLWNFNDEGVIQASKALLKDKEVYLVEIKDYKDKTIYVGSKNNLKINPKGLIILKSEISKAGFKIGSLKIEITDYYRIKDLRNELIFNIISLSIIMYILWMIIFIISDIVIKPINDLTQTTKELSHGDFSKRINIESHDEIATLSDNFNFMIDSIEKSLNKEKTLREIIEAIRSTLDIYEIKRKIVISLGTALHADKCYIIEFEKNSNRFLPIEYEYLSSSDIKSHKNTIMDDYAPELAELAKTGKDIIVIDKDKFISEHNIQGTITDQYFKDVNFKSGLSTPIFYSDKFLGLLVIHYAEKKLYFSNEEVNFVRTLANQTGIALYQSQLYANEKKATEREKLIGNILAKSIRTFDINQIKQIVKDIGIITNADRCYFVEVDLASMKGKPIDSNAEYLASTEIKSIIGYEFPSEDVEKFVELYLSKRDLVIFDYEKFQEENDPQYAGVIRYSNHFNLKSGIGIPFIYMDKLTAVLAIEYVQAKVFPTDDELNFLRIMGNQIGIAYNQIQLYQKTKKTAERETLLRNIISTIRNTLDIDEIKKQVVKEVCLTLDADRCFITEYDANSNRFLPVQDEYLSSSSIQSCTGLDVNNEVPDLANMAKNGEEIIITDKDRYILENNLQNTPVEKHLIKFHIKSGFAVPIYYTNQLLGILVIHYTSRKGAFSIEELQLTRTLAGQIGIALHQSSLFNKVIENAERQELLSAITNTIRSSLDSNQMKKRLVTELGKFLNAERCIIHQIDQNTGKFDIIDEFSEYKALDHLVSYVGIDIEQPYLKFFRDLYINKNEMIAPNWPEYLEKLENVNQETKDWIKTLDIKSDYVFPVIYQDKLLASIYLTYTNNYKYLSENELNSVRFLVDQFGIALHQSELYDTVKQTAEKERILREIVTELRPFKNIEDAFNSLLSKIADYYNVPRTMLIEIPVQENEKPRIGYEYLKNDSIPSIKMASFPEECLEMFKNIIETYSPIVVPDTTYLHPDNIEVQNFFRTNCIGALIGSPLVRYNHETKLLGILFICSNKPRNWSEYEVNLLKSINESVVNVIWEILKTIEVNRLRDTFVTTLAHDLQVPIVGDIKALEFLASRQSTQAIGHFKELIDEALNNDKRILTILKNLLASYQYESGEKELNLVTTDLGTTIKSAIASVKNFADSKSIIFDITLPSSLKEIKADKEEIYKVICILLDNAVTYSKAEGHITINVEYKKNNITICISDNGPGIPEHIKDLIFKRYEMAIEIERNIGAGISLYLAKQIIEVHNGKIWYTTEIGKGTTFCFSLPAKLKEEN